MTYRLIVWGTGLVGKAVLRGLLDHPEYEIAGVIVNNPDKHDKDIGEIIGADVTGIKATTDIEKVLALEADAVAYFGPSAIYADINMANLTAALRAGKNVVDTSMGVFENPGYAPKELVEAIEQACAVHGKTFFSSGIDPGFANDLFPITLLGLCAKVNSVRTIEFIDAGTYPDQESLIQMGLKSKKEDAPVLEIPGIMTAVWGGPLYMIAETLGVAIEDTREVYQRWFTPEPVDYALGRVKAGHCAAHRVELQGIVNGEPRIFIDHYHRLFPDAAPDWQRPVTHHVHANRIEIDGSPTIRQETVLEDPLTGDGNAGTCLATGMRAIGAIPAVCAADPGILSTLDLPLIGGKGGMR
ncbi:MAG: NAD(P)H-dependent amine dehydrogenase family protein [Pseudomonadales bacterium]